MAIAIAAVTESSVNNAGTSHLVNLPAGGASTDLYLLIGSIGSTAATLNALANWTELLDENAAIGLKILTYTGAGVPSDPTFTSSGSTRSAWIAYRLTGVDKSITPQIATTGTGTSLTPDPPSVTPTGGTSKEYLFIAFAGMAGEEADDDTWGNTPPTNYTPSPPRQKACGTVGTNLGGLILSAERLLTTGAAQDPGTFGVDVSAAWRSQHIIVHPLETHSGTGASSNTTPRATATGAKGGRSTATETNTTPRTVAAGTKATTGTATISNMPRATATGVKHAHPSGYVDTFDVLNPKWVAVSGALSAWSATGELAPVWASDDFAELNLTPFFPIPGRAVVIEQATAIAGDITNSQLSLGLQTPTQTVYFALDSGTQLFMAGAGVAQTTIAYDHATMRYWRIRPVGGAWAWDTSPDGITWTNRRLVGVVDAGVEWEVFLSWLKDDIGDVIAPGTGTFDNFRIDGGDAGATNTTPRATATGAKGVTSTATESNTGPRATATGAKGFSQAATASNTGPRATATGAKGGTSTATETNTGPRATASGRKDSVRASRVGLNHGPPNRLLHVEEFSGAAVSDLWDSTFGEFVVAGGVLTPGWNLDDDGDLSWLIPAGLDGRAVSIENVSEISDGDEFTFVYMGVRSTLPGANDYFRLVVQLQGDGQLRIYSKRGLPDFSEETPSDATIAYDHAAMRYWRIRSEGDAFITETSPDRSVWTPRQTVTLDGFHNPANESRAFVGYVDAGGPESGGAFDNFQFESNGEPTVIGPVQAESGSAACAAAARATATGQKNGTSAATASAADRATATGAKGGVYHAAIGSSDATPTYELYHEPFDTAVANWIQGFGGFSRAGGVLTPDWTHVDGAGSLSYSTIGTLEGRALEIENVSDLTGALTANDYVSFFALASDGDEYSGDLELQLRGTGELAMTRRASGLPDSTTTVTYDHATMRFWRIRHEGQVWFAETSPDGSAWTVRRQVLIPHSDHPVGFVQVSYAYETPGITGGAFDNFRLLGHEPAVTATPAERASGSATVTAAARATATGQKNGASSSSDTAAAQTTASGAKGGQGAATASAKARATATISDRFDGEAAASARPTCASSGVKGGQGTATASAASAATASGQKHASSTATVSVAADVTGRHVQTATGSASATAAARASVSGAKGGQSAVSAAESAEAAASGAKTGTAAATASARGRTTAVGTRTGSGASTATARASATASGAKNATATASASATAVVTGTALIVAAGSAAVSNTTPRVTAAGGRTVTVTYGTILEGAGAGRVRSAKDYGGVRALQSDPPTVVD